MKVQCISGGPLPTNCYLLTDDKTGKTAVIDPGFWNAQLEQAVRAHRVEKILLTHGHFDHITGVAAVKAATGAKVYMEAEEADFCTDAQLNLSALMQLPPIAPFSPDVLLRDEDVFSLGKLSIRVLHTPGHTRGGCCYLVEHTLFSGDTLMGGSVGRTDFATGDGRAILQSVHRLRDLPGDWRVLPGHGYETKLSWERKNNPYLEMEADDGSFTG